MKPSDGHLISQKSFIKLNLNSSLHNSGQPIKFEPCEKTDNFQMNAIPMLMIVYSCPPLHFVYLVAVFKTSP